MRLRCEGRGAGVCFGKLPAPGDELKAPALALRVRDGEDRSREGEE
jgi:hypothetical protein